MTDAPKMPAAIIRALIKVKQNIDPAKQSTQTDETGRSFSSASADDIFAAVQGPLADAGFLIELLDDGMEFTPVASGESVLNVVHMKFIPVIHYVGPNGDNGEEAEPISYENPRARIHMIGPYEGMKTCASLRTMAEKTFLRAILKLPTTPQERADEDNASSRAAELAGGYAATLTEAEAPQARGKAKEPYTLDTAASAEMCKAIIAEMEEASKVGKDGAARIAAVNGAFKKRQSDWTKLTNPDQSKVKKRNAELITQMAKPVKEAAPA